MKKRKFLMMLFIVTLTISLLTVPAWAVPTSGTCGDSAQWEFDPSTRILTISGSGEMDFGDSLAPWHDLDKEIIKIRIQEGITSLCFNAFANCRAVESVELPNSLRHIGEGSFRGCYALLKVDLHDDIQTIGKYAFQECRGLKKVKIPAGTTEISYGAFSNCYKLEEVIFHDQLKIIGSYAFSDTPLTTLVVPDSVTVIDDSAFRNCIKLSNVVLGKGMTKVDPCTFDDCTGLTSITIPDWITSIGHGAFRGCTALSYVDLGAGVETVDTDAFKNCPALKRFKVSEENPHLMVSDGVLYDKHKQELLMFPWGFEGEHTVLEGTKTIAGYAAYDRVGLKAITLPAGIREIGKYAFCGCKKIKKINMPEGLQAVRDMAFDGTSISKFVFPSTLTKMGQSLFDGEVEVQEVVFYGPYPGMHGGYMSNVYCNVYYPAYDPSWEGKLDNYGGIPDWTPITCTGKHRTIKEEGKAATCTESGLSDKGYCAYCGEVTLRQETIPATGHSYGAWTPVPDKDGFEERSCKVCDNTEHRKITQEPETQPTVPTTKPPAPTTAPTEPTILPTEPETVPTEPTTLPTEPVTVPTDPTTLPTEPVTVPTEPTALPTEPEPTFTEPSTAPSQSPTEAQPDPPDQAPGGVVWLIVTGALTIVGIGIWLVMKKKK